MQETRLRYGSAPRRRALIVSLVQQTGFLSVPDLAEQLGVSQVTVRRDLTELSATGEIRVVHGGACIPHGIMRTSDYVSRAQRNAPAKKEIATAAAREIGSSDLIALDAGSTIYQLATLLPASFRGTVITNSLPIIELLSHREELGVISLGGRLAPRLQAFVSDLTADNAATFRPRSFFLSAHTVRPDGVYSNADIHPPMKTALTTCAQATFLLADHSKFTTSASVKVCALDQLTALYTDRQPPEPLHSALTEAGVRIVLCGGD